MPNVHSVPGWEGMPGRVAAAKRDSSRPASLALKKQVDLPAAFGPGTLQRKLILRLESAPPPSHLGPAGKAQQAFPSGLSRPALSRAAAIIHASRASPAFPPEGWETRAALAPPQGKG